MRAKIETATRENKRADYLHSSGYAQVASGENMGATSAQSFTERKRLEKERRFVRGYRDSRLGARTDYGHANTSEESAAFAGKIGGFGRGQTSAEGGASGRAQVSAKQRNPIAERRGGK